MKLLFVQLFLSYFAMAATSLEVEEAKKSIQSLIQPLIKGQTKTRPDELKGFRLDTCEQPKIDWMAVILMQKTVTLDYKFKEGCDIQGALSPKVFTPFPADFALRHLKTYERIESQNKITASIESKPVMFLQITEGTLTGPKGNVKFEADYRVRLNPLAKNPVEKNLGGELRISEIYGRKVHIKEKILVR